MVEINSWEPGINSLEETLYLRTLNEFRIEFENNVLYFINYLHTLKKRKVHSIYLEYEMKYLKELTKRYHIKLPKLRIDSEKENRDIDNILILIKKIRKMIDYSYLDIADFYYENFDEFVKLKINKNISIILKELLIKYHHQVPNKIKKAPREKEFFVKGEFCKERIINDSSILKQFYVSLEKSVDKMFLKFYDYLIETKLKEIKSQKVYFLKNNFDTLGKRYFKKKYKVKLKNKKSQTSKEKFLDEAATNLLRFIEIVKK